MNLSVQVIRPFEPFPSVFVRTIFLVGPTPRSEKVPTWRLDALAILAELGFSGRVFMPETLDPSDRRSGFDAREVWEHEALQRADALVYWVPRDVTLDEDGELRMPAFTANIEFGEHMKRGGCAWYAAYGKVMGAFILKAKRYHVPVFETLCDTLAAAVEMIGVGAQREGLETLIPLHVWNSVSFRTWRCTLRTLGEAPFVRVLKTYPEGNFPPENILFQVAGAGPYLLFLR